MQGQRTLIINPTKEDSYEPLEPQNLKEALFDKVLRSTRSRFSPMLIEATQVGRLLNNIEYKVTGISGYCGRHVETYEEATKYLSQIAEEVYKDPNWALKLVKSEVMYGKAKTYGLTCQDPKLVQQLQEDLKHVATVRVNPVEATTKKNSKKSKAETTEVTTEESTDV